MKKTRPPLYLVENGKVKPAGTQAGPKTALIEAGPVELLAMIGALGFVCQQPIFANMFGPSCKPILDGLIDCLFALDPSAFESPLQDAAIETIRAWRAAGQLPLPSGYKPSEPPRGA